METGAYVLEIARKARQASLAMAGLSSELRTSVIEEMAGELEAAGRSIIFANKKDVAAARAHGMSAALIDRLTISERGIAEMALGMREVAALTDPVGEVMKAWRVKNGLWIHKVRVPLGVVAIIYESRPNVTADCAALCFKAGNCVILKGGSESLCSNRAIFDVLVKVMHRRGVPEGVIALVDSREHKAVDELLRLDKYIDVVIPRGGKGLIERVTQLSTIPVIKHYQGICHVYVDEGADLDMAQKICFNAKVQRPATCNAMESMLVHKKVAKAFLPAVARRLKKAGVELRGCPVTMRLVPSARKASDQDYRTEFLDLKLAVKVVDGLDEAIAHVNEYGSHHSDAIVTENYEHALQFLNFVDSACVYVNASTRFTDGNQFGMGAEIGISTDKLHARGPMALEELTTYKYMIFGNGQVRT